MMRKKITSVLMAAAMVLSTQGLPVQAAPAETDDPSAGQTGVSEELIVQVSDYTGTTTKVYADTYAEPGRNRNWREGMVSGNGENGVVTSGAPYSDTLIYQNINLIMPSDHPRELLDVIPGSWNLQERLCLKMMTAGTSMTEAGTLITVIIRHISCV